MSDFDEFRIHAVTVKTFNGTTGMGDTYATPVTYSPTTGDGVLVSQVRHLIRGADGQQVISETTIADPDVAHAAAYTVGTRVTLPDGTTATVLQLKVFDGADTLPSMLEVALT